MSSPALQRILKDGRHLVIHRPLTEFPFKCNNGSFNDDVKETLLQDTLVTGVNGALMLWSMSGELLGLQLLQQGRMVSDLIAWDHETVLAATYDELLVVWKPNDKEAFKSFDMARGDARALFSLVKMSGDLLVCVKGLNQIELRSKSECFACIHTFVDDDHSMDPSPQQQQYHNERISLQGVDDTHFVSYGVDHFLRLWDAIQRRLIMKVNIGYITHTLAVLKRKGLYVAVAEYGNCNSHSFQIWDLMQGKLVTSVQADHCGEVHKIVELEEGLLLSCDWLSIVKVWTPGADNTHYECLGSYELDYSPQKILPIEGSKKVVLTSTDWSKEEHLVYINIIKRFVRCASL